MDILISERKAKRKIIKTAKTGATAISGDNLAKKAKMEGAAVDNSAIAKKGRLLRRY